MSNMIGEKDGIALWNLMANTKDELEKKYFEQVNNAAAKYYKAWFTDSVTQRETKKNQTIWYLCWDSTKALWEVSKFMTAQNASDVTPRMRYGNEEVVELEIGDLLTYEG